MLKGRKTQIHNAVNFVRYFVFSRQSVSQKLATKGQGHSRHDLRRATIRKINILLTRH